MILYKHRIDSLKLKELENIVEEGEDDDSQYVCKTLVHSSLKTNCETIWQSAEWARQIFTHQDWNWDFTYTILNFETDTFTFVDWS